MKLVLEVYTNNGILFSSMILKIIEITFQQGTRNTTLLFWPNLNFKFTVVTLELRIKHQYIDGTTDSDRGFNTLKLSCIRKYAGLLNFKTEN